VNAGGVTEVIAHFIGHLHLAEESVRFRVGYEEFASLRARSEELVAATAASNLAEPGLEESDSDRVKSDFYPDFLEFDYPLVSYKLFHFYNFPSHAFGPFPFDLATPLTPGLPWPSSSQTRAEATNHTPAHGEKVVQIEQQNNLLDNDQYGEVQGLLAELDDNEVQKNLDALNDSSAEKITDHLPPPEAGAADLIAWANAKDGNGSTIDDGSGARPLDVGVYVNGEKVVAPANESSRDTPANPADDLIAPPELVLPEHDFGETGQAAILGSNSTSNAALVIDADEAANSLIVLGDVFETSAIFQINAYRDNDLIHHSGEAGDSSTTVETGDNIADNIAELVAENPVSDFDFPQYSREKLRIDYHKGDFYDIKVVTQHNVILDNDVVVQTTYQSFSTVTAGDGDVGNEVIIYDDASQYDLIVVGGDYHKLNIISQTNILLDDDVVKVAAVGNGEESASSEVETGHNWLFNNAKIHDLGEQSFEALKPHDEIEEFARSLDESDGHDRQSDDDVPSGLSGHGGNWFNILFVRDNYYDFNVIWQHNTIVDIDGAIQFFGGAYGSSNSFKQYVSSGHNAAKNAAEIVDVGTLDKQYVAGNHYEDSLLVQANIVTGNDDSVVYGDTSKLIPEVIAFTDHQDGHQNNNDHDFGRSGWDAQHDPLGHLLS
jgi:hypothetical protein